MIWSPFAADSAGFNEPWRRAWRLTSCARLFASFFYPVLFPWVLAFFTGRYRAGYTADVTKEVETVTGRKPATFGLSPERVPRRGHDGATDAINETWRQQHRAAFVRTGLSPAKKGGATCRAYLTGGSYVCIYTYDMSNAALNRKTIRGMEECICFNLRWVNRRVTQFYDRALRPLGLKATQLPILAGLAARDSATMADFADWLGMERTTLVRNLRPLVRAGWVRWTPAPGARHGEMRLTGRGRWLLARAYPLWQGAQERVLAALGGRRWKAMLRDLAIATQKLN